MPGRRSAVKWRLPWILNASKTVNESIVPAICGRTMTRFKQEVDYAGRSIRILSQQPNYALGPISKLRKSFIVLPGVDCDRCWVLDRHDCSKRHLRNEAKTRTGIEKKHHRAPCGYYTDKLHLLPKHSLVQHHLQRAARLHQPYGRPNRHIRSYTTIIRDYTAFQEPFVLSSHRSYQHFIICLPQ